MSGDPLTIRLKVLDTEPLAWEEARRLAHARVAWRMCQRADAARDAAIETRRLRHLTVLGRMVAVVVLAIPIAAMSSPYRLVVALASFAVLTSWACVLVYRSMKEPNATVTGHRR